MTNVAADPTGSRRAGALLLAAGLALAVVLAVHGISDPWESGFRGVNGGFYHGNFVQNHLRFGLSVTHGGAAYQAIPCSPPKLFFDHHHPAGYPLVLTAVASIAGPSELTLRATALALFLPAIVGLWIVGRRLAGPLTGGLAAFLFAAIPLGGYWGPMVCADGAVAAVGLWTVAAFIRHVERPARWTGPALAALYVLGGLLDWEAHFFGPVCFVIGLTLPARRRAMITVAWLALVALIPVALWFAHGVFIFGSVAELRASLGPLMDQAATRRPSTAELLQKVGGYAVQWITWPAIVAAALGIVLPRRAAASAAASDVDAPRSPWIGGLALLLPGVFNCLLLPQHAVVHDFWIFQGLAGVALLAARGITTLTAWVLPRLAILCVLTAAALVADFGIPVTWGAVLTNRTTRFADTGRVISALLEPGDIVATTEEFHVESYYIPTFVFPYRQTVAQLDEAIRGLALLPPLCRHLLFVLGPQWAGDPLDLALQKLARREIHQGWIVYRVSR